METGLLHLTVDIYNYKISQYINQNNVRVSIYSLHTLLYILLFREQTIIAHHNRIEQLRESYANKLKDSETNCQAVRI